MTISIFSIKTASQNDLPFMQSDPETVVFSFSFKLSSITFKLFLCLEALFGPASTSGHNDLRIMTTQIRSRPDRGSVLDRCDSRKTQFPSRCFDPRFHTAKSAISTESEWKEVNNFASGRKVDFLFGCPVDLDCWWLTSDNWMRSTSWWSISLLFWNKLHPKIEGGYSRTSRLDQGRTPNATTSWNLPPASHLHSSQNTRNFGNAVDTDKIDSEGQPYFKNCRTHPVISINYRHVSLFFQSLSDQSHTKYGKPLQGKTLKAW